MKNEHPKLRRINGPELRENLQVQNFSGRSLHASNAVRLPPLKKLQVICVPDLKIRIFELLFSIHE
ncbi:MAG TPA: hypothetical protein DDZ11_03175 [Lentisphaeria bacterium]|nr:hypothetical protein [Lentisphaeria bacterium]